MCIPVGIQETEYGEIIVPPVGHPQAPLPQRAGGVAAAVGTLIDVVRAWEIPGFARRRLSLYGGFDGVLR